MLKKCFRFVKEKSLKSKEIEIRMWSQYKMPNEMIKYLWKSIDQLNCFMLVQNLFIKSLSTVCQWEMPTTGRHAVVVKQQ